MNNATSPKHRKYGLFLLVPILVGVLLTMGAAATMQKTDKAEFCGSCHAMSEAVLTHQKSIHAELACNDCHTPHALPSKLPFKAKAGLHDAIVNTTGPVPDVIRANQETKDAIKANCIRCHAATVKEVNMDVKPACTDCHRSVPHMQKAPISKREVADV